MVLCSTIGGEWRSSEPQKTDVKPPFWTLMIDEDPHRCYSMIRVDEEALRTTFFQVFFTLPINALLVEAPTRILSLLTGSFFRKAKALADWQWSVIRMDNRETSYLVLLGKQTLLTLTEEIVKLATLPLAIIALEAAALYGIAAPLDGRYYYGEIEQNFAINSGIPNDDSWRIDKEIRLYASYFAPCMQPDEYRIKHNLFIPENTAHKMTSASTVQLFNTLSLISEIHNGDLNPKIHYLRGKNVKTPFILLDALLEAIDSVQKHSLKIFTTCLETSAKEHKKNYNEIKLETLRKQAPGILLYNSRQMEKKLKQVLNILDNMPLSAHIFNELKKVIIAEEPER